MVFAGREPGKNSGRSQGRQPLQKSIVFAHNMTDRALMNLGRASPRSPDGTETQSLLPPDFREFLHLLNYHKVEYLLVGGYAVSY